MAARLRSFLPLVLIAALTSLWGASAFSEGFDWPRWRGPNGDGVSQETDWDPGALTGGARVLWNINIGYGYSNPVIQGSRLYAMGATGDRGDKLTFFCLDPETGRTIWRREFALGVWQPQSSPAVDGDLLFGLSTNGKLLCLKAGDGSEVWRMDLKADFGAVKPTSGWAASPVVDGDLLLLNANSLLMALDKTTGQMKWKTEDAFSRPSWGSYATPVIVDIEGTRCVLLLGPSTLQLIKTATGEKVWSYDHGDSFHPIADPVVRGEVLFLSLTDRCGQLSMKPAPTLRWSSSDLESEYGTPVLRGGFLYGSHIPADYSADTWAGLRRTPFAFRCLDWETGRVMWEKSMASACVTAAGDKLLLLDLDGVLRIAEASPASYTEISSADVLAGAKKPRVFATPPVLWNGKVYCRSFGGELVCIDVSK